MIRHLTFPASGGRMYKRHPLYVLNTARAAGIDCEVSGDTTIAPGCFEIECDGSPAKAVIDYSNFPVLPDGHEAYKHWFKFHAIDGHPANVHPFPVVSFHDWTDFAKRQAVIRFGYGDRIVSRQHPHGNAEVARHRIQGMLRAEFGGRVDTAVIRQAEFWSDINRASVGVFVPGARNDMLDRGQAQYMAFGCCTISPRLTTRLPFGRRIEPGVHHLACADDYTDLVDVVKWAESHPEHCRVIGRNAKQLFAETSTPRRIWRWVSECMDD